MRIHLGVPREGEKVLFDSDDWIQNEFKGSGPGNAAGAQEFVEALGNAFMAVAIMLENYPQAMACIQLPSGKKVEIKAIQ
jgi:3-deoxy-D-manno-octulosonic acid (KDO) 8-phosphate synthase